MIGPIVAMTGTPHPWNRRADPSLRQSPRVLLVGWMRS